MLLPLLLMGLIGVFALSPGPEVPPPRRKVVTMGDAENESKEKDGKAANLRLEKYLTQTMRMSDAEEVARRARRMAGKYPGTAKLVMRRAKELRAAENAPKAPDAVYRATKTKESPAIFNLKWANFLMAMVRDVSDISANNHVGYFSFAWSRLVKLGLASNLRKEDKQIGGTVRKMWTADLNPPPTLDEFLESSKLQYEAFVKSVLDYLPTLTMARFQAFIGKEIEGKRVTLSGLLAVAHQAGIDGLKSWLANPSDREKYPHTTEAFNKATGIF